MKIILQGGRVFGVVSVIIAEERKHPDKMISLFSEDKVPDEFSSFMFSELLSIYIVVISYRKFGGHKYFALYQSMSHSHFPKLPL